MFPMAFLQGMAHPTRSAILLDTGDDKPSTWLWGSGENAPDAAILAYAADAETLRKSVSMFEDGIAARGGGVVHKVILATRPEPLPNEKRSKFAPEAFGFADGMSQPVIRGTKRWMREEDKIHTVEPGEFLLGYPDNRGFMPPSPTIRATADPTNILPVIFPHHSDAVRQPDFSASGANADRDFGRGGTFLVIRQLEQDVPEFEKFLTTSAAKVAGKPGVPKGPDGPNLKRIEEWIGAKMIGRWRDGTSLVRFPNRPGTGWEKEHDVEPDNEFLFGTEDPQGQRCPFGAHIRRANPRESMVPGSMEQLSIVNRHRILRMGRGYDAAGSGDPKAKHQGPAVHVPERRYRTAVRIHPADLGDGAAIPRPGERGRPDPHARRVDRTDHHSDRGRAADAQGLRRFLPDARRGLFLHSGQAGAALPLLVGLLNPLLFDLLLREVRSRFFFIPYCTFMIDTGLLLL